MTIGTSTAAVEWEGHPDCDIECWFAPTLRALTTERDAAVAALTQSQAETAAAYERAAQWHTTAALNALNSLHCGSENSEYRAVSRAHEFHSDCANVIRKLTTPDQTAALDAVKAEAMANGMLRAAGICKASAQEREHQIHVGKGVPAHAVNIPQQMRWTAEKLQAEKLADAILAAIPKGGA